MNLYGKYVLPRLIDLVMRSKADAATRARFVPLASGRVLEVGIGSALNVPFYGPKVESLYAVDPSLELWRLARRRIEAAAFPIEFLAASAERIPREDGTFDCAVTTWTLCTIPNTGRALKEMKRVLKPGGMLIFVEHGWAPDRGVQAWQNRLNPLWKRIAGGCNMQRKIDELVTEAGFRVTQLERAYGSGPRPLAYLYKGLAHRID